MKVYYSVIRNEIKNDDTLIDDYVIDTGFGLIQIDAQNGVYLHSYETMKDYLESYPHATMVEVDYEG